MTCHCGHTQTNQDRDIHFVSVSNLHNSTRSTANPSTDFSDLFRCYNDHFCNRCNRITPQEQRLYYDIPQENRYICMVIHNVFLAERIFKPLLINQFPPNNIILPGLNNIPNATYSLRTAVMRQGNNSVAGHYLVWTRNINNNKWLRISDFNSTAYNNLIKNLRDAYLLFIEKN